MAFLEIRGTGTDAREPLEVAHRYFNGVSYLTQGRALDSGLRAYLAVMRRAAKSQAPFSDFRKSTGYRWGTRIVGRGVVTGYLYSAGYGNILEAGADAHYAPIYDTVNPKSGAVYAGLGKWMRQHAPELLASWGPTAKFAKVGPRTGRPWVIPASQSVEPEAIQAFESVIVKVVAEEMM